MPTSSPASLPLVRLLVVLATVGTVAGACVSDRGATAGSRPVTAATAQPTPIPAPPEGPPEAVPLGADGDIPLVPPDGRWYVDAEGQQYFLVAVPRLEGHYVWDGENSVRLRGGLPLKLARYDDTTFYAKIFRVDGDEQPQTRRRLPATAEERAKVAATYEVKLPKVPAPALVPFDRGLPQSGQWRDGLTIADMNEDGHLDIVHAPPRKALGSTPLIFLGDGAGNWRVWREQRFPSARYDYGDVAVADFDRDGHLDVALAMHLLTPMLLFGDGKGNFRAADYLLPRDTPPFSSRAIRTRDIDGDGLPDLTLLGEGMGLNVAGEGMPETVTGGFGILHLRNRGDGSFERLPALSPRIHGHALALGDFDGDDRADIAVAAGVVGFRDVVLLSRAQEWQKLELPIRPHSYLDGVAAGDVDGDGKDDVVIGYVSHEADEPRSGVDLFLSRPGQQPAWDRRTLAVVPGRVSFGALAMGDLNADGHLDVVGVDGSGAVHFFLGSGGGAFATASGPPVPPGLAGCKGYDVEIADLDDDRRPELVIELAGEETSAGVLGVMMGQRADCRDHGAIRVWKVTGDGAAR